MIPITCVTGEHIKKVLLGVVVAVIIIMCIVSNKRGSDYVKVEGIYRGYYIVDIGGNKYERRVNVIEGDNVFYECYEPTAYRDQVIETVHVFPSERNGNDNYRITNKFLSRGFVPKSEIHMLDDRSLELNKKSYLTNKRKNIKKVRYNRIEKFKAEKKKAEEKKQERYRVKETYK